MIQNDMHNSQENTYSFVVLPTLASQRIDLFIAQQFPKYSRTFFQKLIAQGLVQVNNKTTKSSYQIKANDVITVTIPPARIVPHILSAQAEREIAQLPVTIVYENPEFLIINKPAGLIVHKPSAASSSITLVDWLLYTFPTIAVIGDQARPGIVHRLDKDTSGLMIIARTTDAHRQLSSMFRQRTINKTYIAVVQGHPKAKGTINLPIGRDIFKPIKMAHTTHKGRDAITNYQVLENLSDAAVIQAQPITGRTHQIRVHLAAIGHPIIGDQIYGKKSSLINRQALHAQALSFVFNEASYSFHQELPQDMRDLIRALKIT